MEINEIEKEVCQIIKESCQFNADNIVLNEDLRDNYGIDSIALVELLVNIEAKFDITVDGNMLTYDNFSTANVIADYVYKKINT